MKKNNLDNFFAEKLSQRKFEFDPAHWEAAEKLIELQEQDDRAKRFGWWMLLIPLLGLIGYLCYFAKASTTQQPANIEMTQSGMTSGLNFTNNKSEADQIITLNKATENKATENKATENITTETKTTTTENDFSATSTSEAVETKNVTEPTSPKKMKSSFSGTLENNNTTVTENPATIKTSSAVETIREKRTSIAIPAEFNGNNIRVITPDSTTRNIKQTKAPKLDQASLAPVQPTIDQETKPVVSAAGEVVASPAFEFPALLASIDATKDSEVGVPVTTDRKKIIDIGLMAGTLFYSTKSNSDLDLAASNGGYRLGLTAGMTAGFRFSDHFSLHADALYQWRKEDLGVISTTGESYGFGGESYTRKSKVESFHSIEIPIYLQYAYNGHSIEAGVSCRYLLAIKGVDKTEGTADVPENNTIPSEALVNGQRVFSSQDDVWLPEDKFDRFTTSYMLGYRYWVNDRLSFGLRAIYTPSARYTPTVFDPEREDSQTFSTQTNSLNFSLSAKYYFNKRSSYRRI